MKGGYVENKSLGDFLDSDCHPAMTKRINDIIAKTNEGFAVDMQKLKELNQAIQDNPTMPERIKDLVQQQTQSMEYLNAYIEMNAQLANKMQTDGCVVMGGERVYPTNGSIPALPIPKNGYIDSNGTIVIPIKN